MQMAPQPSDQCDRVRECGLLFDISRGDADGQLVAAIICAATNGTTEYKLNKAGVVRASV